MRECELPLTAFGRGLAAGLAGTAAMTASQELLKRLGGSSDRESEDGERDGDPWQNAPAAAVVGKRLIDGLFQKEVSPERIPLLTNVVHWTYGTAWGGVYGLVQGTMRANAAAHGLLFGAGVWAMSYVGLVPMGLYKPPWKYPAQTVFKDLSYHLVYGSGSAAAYEALGRTSATSAANLSGSRGS